MKYLITTILLVLTNACAVAQKDKKESPAFKISEEAYKEYVEQNFEKASDLINKAVKKDSTYINAWEYKAEIDAKRGNFKEVIRVCNKLISMEPDNFYNYYRLGFALKSDMKYQEAKEAFEKYLRNPKKIDPRKKEYIENEIKNMDACDNLVKNPVPFKPENMGLSINTSTNEYFPGITIDGKNFYFTRLVNDGRMVQEDFYVSRKTDKNEYLPAIAMPFPINTKFNEGTISVTADGNFVFFTACDRLDNYNMPLGKGSCDIYVSAYFNGKWSEPSNMSDAINSPSWESQPSISPDGLTIYFTSGKPGGFGGTDIYKSEFDTKNKVFKRGENLGPDINTAGNESSPFIHFDNQTLYFVSNGHLGMGNNDIFVAKKNEAGKFSGVKNIGYPINTGGDEIGLIVDRMGNYGYLSSDRPGGMGGLDIYKFELPEAIKPEAVNYVKGIVFDALTREKIGAKIELFDLSTGLLINTLTSNSVTGEFLVVLRSNNNYMLSVDQTNYLFYTDNFSLKDLKNLEPYEIEVPLKKPDKDIEIKLANVFFDVDKFEIKKESELELEKLVLLLRKFPFMKIEIGGHTDNTGDKAKNKALSFNRAKSVKEYLIAKGVEGTRLSAMGYGDTKPLETNDTDAGKSANRRTVFKVISVN